MSGGAELPQDVWAEEVGEHAVVCGTSNCKHDMSCGCPAVPPCIERVSTNAERINASSHAGDDHVEVQGVPSTTQAALHCRSRRRAMLSPHRTSCSRSRPRGWQTPCSYSLWLTARCSPRYSCSNDAAGPGLLLDDYCTEGSRMHYASLHHYPKGAMVLPVTAKTNYDRMRMHCDLSQTR